MAKVSLNKLLTIKKGRIIKVQIGEEEIELKSYLPIAEKATLVEKVINSSLDDTNHINTIKAEMFFIIYVLVEYTNINFTEKQLEDAPALYDLIKLNNIDGLIFDKFDEQEYKDLRDLFNMTIKHVSEYINSFAGIINTVSNEQSATQNNVDQMLEQLQGIANNSLLKDVIDNMKKEN